MGAKADPEGFTREAILNKIAEGIPLAQACRQYKLGLTTWYDWAAKDPEFAERIAHARKAGHEIIATGTLDIADEEPPTLPNGGKDSAHVAWQKNRIWARMQLLAKWDPKRYGDKLELSGDEKNPLQVKQTIDASKLSTDVLAQIIAAKNGTDRS